jgi:hypothetical protein
MTLIVYIHSSVYLSPHASVAVKGHEVSKIRSHRLISKEEEEDRLTESCIVCLSVYASLLTSLNVASGFQCHFVSPSLR